MKILFSALALLTVTLSKAQTSTDYSDVAVLVNDNSSISLNIGAYFQQARNVPAINIIHLIVPTTEIIFTR